MVPEGRGVIRSLTVEENLALGSDVKARSRGQASMANRFTGADIYERFPVLEDRRDLPAGLLSGGEQQILAISRALLTNPALLMLDEPSFGLAPRVARSIFDLLAEFRDGGLAILLVEQNVRQALTIADRCYVLERGHVAAVGTPAELNSAALVQSAYFGGTGVDDRSPANRPIRGGKDALPQ